jgi:hypothetical protein
MILTNGLSKNAGASVEFLQSRLAFNEIERQGAEARVQALRASLTTYDQHTANASNASRGDADLQRPTDTVIPQVDNSFLERLMTLTSADKDQEFRQNVIRQMQEEALQVIPLNAEQEYYRTLVESFRGFQNRARAADPAEMQLLRSQVNAVIDEAVAATEQMNEIYLAVSQTLNPSTVLYSVTAPAVTTTEAPVSAVRLAVLWFVLMIITLIAAVAGSLIHARIVAPASQTAAAPEHERAPLMQVSPGPRAEADL